MNSHCDQCDLWLQELLDGTEPGAAVVEHLGQCSTCHELYEAAAELRRGLALLPPPEPSADLSGRIVTAVLFDRRRQARRRRVVARVAALAAAVLVAWFIADQRTPPPTPPVVQVADSGPSLRETVSLASNAVADLTSKRMDEARESTRFFLPTLEAPALPGVDPTEPLEATARPLQTATQGVSAGLEPVTDRARRAFALFVRDLPSSNLLSKPGS